MAGAMLTFAGAFTTFTYLRPFLESRTHVTVPQLSLLLLALGSAGFVGTSVGATLAKRHLYLMLGLLPVLLAGATVWMLLTQHILWSVTLAMFAWGAFNSAIPVCWSTWLSQGVRDEPESGGGLLVGAISFQSCWAAHLGDISWIASRLMRPSLPERCSCFYPRALLEAARGFKRSRNEVSYRG
jgi:predicted MFS family arabinose efflux permease